MQAQGILSRSEALIGKPREVPSIHPRGVTSLSTAVLEVEAQFSRIRPRRHKMRSTERGQEIVERHFVGQVDGREPQAPLVTVAMEQVVVADAVIEQVARVDARRIVIVILGTWRRYLEPRRPVQRWVACNQRSTQRWGSAAAEEPGLYLLVC